MAKEKSSGIEGWAAGLPSSSSCGHQAQPRLRVLICHPTESLGICAPGDLEAQLWVQHFAPPGHTTSGGAQAARGHPGPGARLVWSVHIPPRTKASACLSSLSSITLLGSPRALGVPKPWESLALSLGWSLLSRMQACLLACLGP